MSLWIRLCNHTYIHTYTCMSTLLQSTCMPVCSCVTLAIMGSGMSTGCNSEGCAVVQVLPRMMAGPADLLTALLPRAPP